MKTVAYSSPFVPAEWIAAHGLRPARLSFGPAGDRSEIDVIHGVCPYARGFIHAALSEAQVSAVVMTTTCDQMRHAADLLRSRSDRPLFLMNVPSMWQTPAARKLYLDEIRRLGLFLLEIGGQPLRPQELTRLMLKYDHARQSVRAARPRLPAGEFARAVAAVPALEGPSNGPAAHLKQTGGIPLAILGGPLFETDYAVLDLVERAGGRIVLDASEGGERTMPAPFDRQRAREDPLGELVDAYFGTIPDAFRRPNSGLYEWLEREITARNVRGILFWRYVWCDVWHAELHRLREWSPVPVLDLDAAGHENGTASRTAARLEAFLEMLA